MSNPWRAFSRSSTLPHRRNSRASRPFRVKGSSQFIELNLRKHASRSDDCTNLRGEKACRNGNRSRTMPAAASALACEDTVPSSFLLNVPMPRKRLAHF